MDPHTQPAERRSLENQNAPAIDVVLGHQPLKLAHERFCDIPLVRHHFQTQLGMTRSVILAAQHQQQSLIPIADEPHSRGDTHDPPLSHIDCLVLNRSRLASLRIPRTVSHAFREFGQPHSITVHHRKPDQIGAATV